MHRVSIYIKGILIKNEISLLNSFVKFRIRIGVDNTDEFSFPNSEFTCRVCMGQNGLDPYFSSEEVGDNDRCETALDIISMFTKEDWYKKILNLAKAMWNENKESIEVDYDL